MKTLGVCLLASAFLLTIGNAHAQEEEILKFRLVARTLDPTTLDTPVEGRSIKLSKSAGVAVFDDGRLADKQFVNWVDNGGDTGTYGGYSTYTFLNGDSLTLKFTGGWGADGEIGEYEVLSGTGAYAGATGKGRFVPLDNPWDKAGLYDVTINVKRGGS